MLAPIYEKQYSNFIEIAFYDKDIFCSSIFIYIYLFFLLMLLIKLLILFQVMM
jgi:hypothetical protein